MEHRLELRELQNDDRTLLRRREEGVAAYPLESRAAPGDDGDAQVVGQLHEVLGRGRLAAVRLRVAEEQDGGHVAAQEVLAQDV